MGSINRKVKTELVNLVCIHTHLLQTLKLKLGNHLSLSLHVILGKRFTYCVKITLNSQHLNQRV